MKYDILHELPGRMRVRCRHLRLDPDNRIELCRWVSEHSELVSASLSTRTGNLLILYAKDVSRESILIILNDLQLFGVASIVPDGEPQEISLGRTTANAFMREATGALVKAVIPTPLRQIKSGWALGCVLFDLAERLANEQMTAFSYGVVKVALYALCSASLPARFILVAGLSLIEFLLPCLKPSLPESPRLVEAVPVHLEIAQPAV